jgi:hypothetical protein
MGWSIGYDDFWQRDVGYGVPAVCDHPGCSAEIDRGLSYVCENIYGDEGCGLFFCGEHLVGNRCERCWAGQPPFEPTPDVEAWTHHKATDPSWAEWRARQEEPIEN